FTLMKYSNYKIALYCIAASMLLSFASCSKFVDVGAPSTQIGVHEAYQSDVTATSAIIGLYNNSFIDNLTIYFTGYLGCSADDIQYATSSPVYDELINNALTQDNANITDRWASAYSEIYQTNLAIENLIITNALTPAVKNQLLGEAKTWRAFMYFYLVNLF